MVRALATTLVLLLAASLSAQETANRDDQSTRRSTASPHESHIIFVPYDRLDQLGIKRDGQVILQADEYRKLLDRARLADVLLRTLPTREAVLHEARYRGRVEAGRLTVEAQLELEALGDGWSVLEWHLLKGAIASVSGAPPEKALVRALGPARYQLLIAGPGKTTLTVQVVFPVRVEPGARHCTLYLPPAGVATLDAELPGKGLSIQLSPQLVHSVRETDATTNVRVNLGGQKQLTLSWYPRAAGDEGATLLSADVEALVSIDAAVIETDTRIRFNVLRGAAERLRLALPDDHRILAVDSDEVRRWSVREADGTRQLDIELYRPVSEDFTLRIRTDRPLSGEQAVIELPLPLGMARVAGAVALKVAEQLVALPASAEGAVQVHGGDLPQWLRAGQIFFRFYADRVRIPVAVEPLKPWIRMRAWHDATLVQGDVRIQTQATVDVQRAGIFGLTVRLPAGFVLESVRCPGIDRYDVTDADGRRELRITFEKQRTGRFSLELLGLVPMGFVPSPEPKQIEITLPSVEGIDREESIARINLPESLRAVYSSAASEGVVPVTESDLERPVQLPALPRGYRVAALVRVEKHPARIALEVARRPARVLAEVATGIQLHQTTATVRSQLHYTILYSGVSQLLFRVPEAAVSRLHVRSSGAPSVREWRHEPDPQREGWHRVVVTLQREAIGSYTLVLEYELPIRPDDSEDRGTVVWSPVELLGVEREEGEVGISRDEGLSVEAEVEGAEPIDPRELQRLSPGQQPRLAYRYVRHPVVLTLRVARPPVREVADTLVRRALTECLIPSEGRVTCRTIFLLKTTERQRLRVLLHEQARILAVSVAGKAVLPEVAQAKPDDQGRLAYYIPVQADPDKEFALVITYQPGKDIRLSSMGSITVDVPSLSGDVVLDEQLLLCWLPRRWYALTASGLEDISTWDLILGTVPARPAWLPPSLDEFASHLDGWLASAGTAHRYALYRSFTYRDRVELAYVSWPGALTVCSGAVLLAAVVLLAFRFEWRAVVVSVALLALLAISFVRSEYAFLLTQGSLPGAALGIALWTVVGWVRLARSRRWQRPATPEESTSERTSQPADDASQ